MKAIETRRMLVGTVLGTLGLGFGPCSEPVACTLIGCPDPITLELTADAWAGGEYAVTLEAKSGSSFRCSLELAGSENAAGSEGGAYGTAEGGWPATCVQLAGDSAEEWEFPRMYFASPLMVYLQQEPSELEVTVELDGEQLVSARLTPSYDETYPNGKECHADPCRSATLTLELD